MFQLILGYFRGPVKLKRFTEEDYQLMKNAGLYGCLSKKNCQLKWSAMARNTFNIRRSR